MKSQTAFKFQTSPNKWLVYLYMYKGDKGHS